MEKVSGGKYCSKCAKNVIDFSGLSDTEIIRLIEKFPGPICGSMHVDQLSRTYDNRQQASRSRLNKILAGLMLVGVTKQAVAQQDNSLPTELIVQEDSATNIPKNNPEKTAESNATNVEGVLLDAKSRETIPFTTLILKGTKTGVVTDLEGKFNLSIPDSLVSDTMILAVRGFNSEPIELNLNKEDLGSSLEILISPKGCEIAIAGVTPTRYIGGAIAVVIVKKKKWWQFWK